MISWLSVVLAVNGSHPAYAAPAALWGELKPVDAVTLAPARDHTAFDDTTQPWSAALLTVAVDVWNQTLLEATNSGFAVWDLAASPKNPPRLGAVGLGAIPKKPVGAAANLFVVDVAAPPTGSNLAVLAQDNGAGVLLIDLTNKAAPRVVYQDGDPSNAEGKSCVDAYTASFGGKPYALLACKTPRPGVALYDLTAAAAIAGTFQEVAPDAASLYPSLFLGDGKLVTTWLEGGLTRTKTITHLDGVENFVVTNSTGGGGFDLWDFSTATAPRRLGGGGGTDAFGPIAIWKAGTRYFVGGVTLTQLQLFEVTGVLKETATDAGAVVSWVPTVRPFDDGTRLVGSRAADGSVFLSFATGLEPPHDTTGVGLAGEELLYDVSDPTAPRDITPPGTMVSGFPTTYWGYGYQFGWVRAGGGRFAGSFFYRAALGMLDVHQWTPPLNRPPVITSMPLTTAVVKRAYDYQIVATDPEGKTLSFVKLTGPASMTFLAPGEVSWVPEAAEIGSNPVAVQVSDGKNNVLHSWTITVSGPAADGGVTDGGSNSDGGTNPAGPPKGCGCQAGAGPLGFVLLAVSRLTRRRVSRPSG